MEKRGNTAFPERWATIESARQPFRAALSRHFAGRDNPRLLIYTPPYENPQHQEPACVLAITAQGWELYVANPDDSDDSEAIDRIAVSFSHTLWVELTTILLYGQLSLIFVADGEVCRISVEFNTVMRNFYYEVTLLILLGMAGRIERPAPDRAAMNLTKVVNLPLKFGNALLDSVPSSETLLAAVSWPALWSKPLLHLLSHGLSPAGAVGVTAQTLIVAQEEQTEGWRIGRHEDPHYGESVFFLPRERLLGWSAQSMGELIAITLSVGTLEVEQPWEFAVPSSSSEEVQTALRAWRQAHEQVGLP